MMSTRTYEELVKIESFEDRIRYLSLVGKVAEETFGGYRYLNQLLYRLPEWKRVRRNIIIRDEGYDLAHREYPINGGIYVHHLNPITAYDILQRRGCVFDENNLISTSLKTHNIIHYSDVEASIKDMMLVERTKNDTCPWRV